MVFSTASENGANAAKTRGERWARLRELQREAINYFNVIYALMMHDIKNRFFGSGIGQIVMVLWPFAHILLIIAIWYFTKKPNPYGTSQMQYAAVSIWPFICWSYCMRWIAYSAMTNRSFMQYPIVKHLDIILARAALEVVSITIVAALMIVLLVCLGDDAMPLQHAEAVYAVCATLFLSVGMGVFNAAVTFLWPMWNFLIVMVIIACYPLSGIYFVASEMPEQVRIPLSYNPVLQCIEWLRSAYYFDYPTKLLDKAYVLEFGLVSLTAGLVLERILRRLYQ